MDRRMLLALALVGALGAPAAAANPEVEPRADELMHRMSDYLAKLPSFRFNTTGVDESVTTDGQKIQFLRTQKLAVRRPDKLRSDGQGPIADYVFRYDGREFSVYGKRAGYYATAAAPAKLDAAIDHARERFGIEAPAADLLSTNVYGALMPNVQTGRYIGLEPIDGTPCHHLAFTGKDTDFQIWIKDGAQPLPVRYVITSKDVRGEPEFAASLSGWETNVELGDDLFKFDPPKGATRIQFLPPGQAKLAKPPLREKVKENPATPTPNPATPSPQP